ncbi:MAG: ATP-dependent DNA ligase [Candidatus Eremiobacter antarcticus]|nr:ATP-dependent DNA ligase [Candidatus Eremiobacteraeota bacterium]MBC5808994.1 ATP-dependent DNA ligase [Candidatus Eremiobacteraeota bacterium]PZR60331.1 MAG: ATP-dependent DNA ligase [Candidatus Eremiobacter sp. RRmetagenome_bin22]
MPAGEVPVTKSRGLPLRPPYPPMEAQSVEAIPQGKGWQYEPKWDGFRCIAFRDGDDVYLQSKAGQPLARYFPEVVKNLQRLAADRFVIDGELVIRVGSELSFDDLLMRIHPAASRVKLLSRETPSTFIVFDLLVDSDGRLLTSLPLAERRPLLERFAQGNFKKGGGIRLSRASAQRAVVDRWFASVGGALDGVIAKRTDLDYRSGDRSGAQKVKKLRTADCVVGGFRYASSSKVIGSLLLGLYDDAGLLNHVGFTSGLKTDQRKELVKKLTPLIAPPGFTGRAPGGPSRWSTERTEQWEPLKPELVVEVSYDHVSGERFRHGTRLLRWRPDKAAKQCTMEQLNLTTTASALSLST